MLANFSPREQELPGLGGWDDAAPVLGNYPGPMPEVAVAMRAWEARVYRN